MIRRKEERVFETKQMFGGQGQALMGKILNSPEEMYEKGRVFSHIILEKGCEVGWHVHQGDGETYYILKGRGEYNDNGEIISLNAGDVAFVDEGQGHSLKNNDDEPLEMIALVLYK